MALTKILVCLLITLTLLDGGRAAGRKALRWRRASQMERRDNSRRIVLKRRRLNGKGSEDYYHGNLQAPDCGHGGDLNDVGGKGKGGGSGSGSKGGSGSGSKGGSGSGSKGGSGSASKGGSGSKGGSDSGSKGGSGSGSKGGSGSGSKGGSGSASKGGSGSKGGTGSGSKGGNGKVRRLDGMLADMFCDEDEDTDPPLPPFDEEEVIDDPPEPPFDGEAIRHQFVSNDPEQFAGDSDSNEGWFIERMKIQESIIEKQQELLDLETELIEESVP